MACTSTTDLRKLVKIKSITDLYDTLTHNGPSKLITQELANRILVDKEPPPNGIAMIKAEQQRFAKFAKYAACICPNVDVVRNIVAFASGGDILEVGAGTGLWAKLLKAEGCKVTATDIYPPAQSEQFTKVIKLSCGDALKKYPHIGCLFMCMPSIQFPIDFAGDCCVVIGGDPNLALRPGRATVKQYYSIVILQILQSGN